MLIVMRHGAPQQDIDRVVSTIEDMGYHARPMPGKQRTTVGLVGNDGRVDSSRLEALPGVQEIIHVTKPYKQVSREWKPESTVVRLPGGLTIGGDDVIVMAGEGASAGMERLGASSGATARLRRAMQFLAMDQLPDFHVYELALEQGRAIVAVRIGDADARRAAVDVLRTHGAHFVNRFGAWATEEIASWSGPMPQVPQHMQR